MINLLQCCVTHKCQIALDYYDGSPNITPHRLRTASVEAGPKRAFTEGQCPVQAPPQPLNENSDGARSLAGAAGQGPSALACLALLT